MEADSLGYRRKGAHIQMCYSLGFTNSELIFQLQPFQWSLSNGRPFVRLLIVATDGSDGFNPSRSVKSPPSLTSVLHSSVALLGVALEEQTPACSCKGSTHLYVSCCLNNVPRLTGCNTCSDNSLHVLCCSQSVGLHGICLDKSITRTTADIKGVKAFAATCPCLMRSGSKRFPFRNHWTACGACAVQ